MASFHLTICIRGYHVYKDTLTPVIGEEVNCEREPGNREDPYTVAIKRGDRVVGHVPHNISCVSTLFIRRGCTIVSSVSGPRRYSDDLPQGGLELPCVYKFTSPSDLAGKARKILEDEGNTVDELTIVQSKFEGIISIAC